ncbi:MAG: helix-turn-helix transcriptional regulator [Azospirillaceae bacterium]|nr:helix-turn-helix transcriptional regulator [Azospirillaceae bacterium]
MNSRLAHTRSELADFLRRRRESLSPLDVGLPAGQRRRTPGLRREEVAALAGVGLTWYTWLEQGRDISVSTAFLDHVAGVLRLDETERRHLFLLAHHRPPSTLAKRWCRLPPFVRRLIDDLPTRPAHVLNLRWDVIGWNTSSDRLFGFSEQTEAERNMLWMLFRDDTLSSRIVAWDRHAAQIVASFRRDFAQAPDDPDMLALVGTLCATSRPFHDLWHRHDVHGCCQGKRSFITDSAGLVRYEHASFVIDEDHHLRLVIYATLPGNEVET